MKIIPSLALFAALSLPAADFLATHRPSFWHGAEFPGATGTLSVAEGVLTLKYDFSKGGHYVAAHFPLPERPVARTLSLEASFDTSTELTLRVTDATGQAFQQRLSGAPGDWSRLELPVDGSWPGCWGGAGDHVLHQPIRQFEVLAENLTPDHMGGAAGELRVRNIAFSADAPARAEAGLPLPGVPFADLVRRATAARDALQRTVPALEAKGLGAKSRATLATLDHFLPWILEDVARGFTNRAEREARELASLGEKGARRAQDVLDGRAPDFPVPHFRTSKIDISHAQMVADRVWPDGRVDRGPVFLTGYGHFGTVQRNLHQLPPLGNHILQMEIGPNGAVREDGSVNTNHFRSFFDTAARAAAANVQVTLLLSPHYFPDWAFRKWPHLKDCAGGFFRQCVYAPEARAVEERYLRALIPLIRGNPALHSVCLSNEPETHVYAKCPVLRREWPKWLARRHGTVAAFNAKMKTDFPSFADVPMPENFRNNPRSPVLAEFARFNQEMFADWHRWMADLVHELAPELPVHAKIMINPCQWDGNATFYSVDPARFGALSQYNGNDAYCNYRSGAGWGWIHDWTLMEAGYDWQRSVADLPVFNTENHIQPDRSKGYLPGIHTYATLWQNAIHGQSATTLWCWERAYDSGKSDFNGLILERPEAFEAWAHAALDLSRLADVLAPIQNLPPSVLLFWSADAILRGETKAGAFHRAYRAANFLGQPLGVATPDMLASGRLDRPLDRARVILLPDVSAIPADVQAGLDRFVAKGGQVLPVDTARERELAVRLCDLSKGWSLPDLPVARECDSDRTAWGVETRGFRKDGASYISICSHLRAPKKVRLESAGVDLITGLPVPAVLEVAPLRPLLVRLDAR